MPHRVYEINDLWPATRELMEMEKRPAEAIDTLKWPVAGDKARVELVSPIDRSIRFYLDLSESIRSTQLIVGAVPERKNKQQVRAGSAGIVRIDMATDPKVLIHRNPDGNIVRGSHIHLDIDGYGLRWAIPLADQTVVVPESGDYTTENMFLALVDSCHIEGLPRVEFSLGV